MEQEVEIIEAVGFGTTYTISVLGKKYEKGELGQNCYLMANPKSGEAVNRGRFRTPGKGRKLLALTGILDIKEVTGMERWNAELEIVYNNNLEKLKELADRVTAYDGTWEEFQKGRKDEAKLLVLGNGPEDMQAVANQLVYYKEGSRLMLPVKTVNTRVGV